VVELLPVNIEGLRHIEGTGTRRKEKPAAFSFDVYEK
jgi:hypothetical protein